MKQKFKIPLTSILLLALFILSSHDLFLKMDTYILQPNQEATLSLYNGTFDKSENLITRDRMLDASLVAQGKRTSIKPEQWIDQDSTITYLNFNTGEAGTYVAGVSTKARNIELSANDFNSYLEHDGVLDMLNYRKENNLLDQGAIESYQKHVKAIYQVGDVKTEDWKNVLGYPIEMVPMANPYEKNTGDQITVLLLLDGKPLPNQLVFANYIKNSETHSHGDHSHDKGGVDHAHTHEHNDDQHHDHTDDSSHEGHTHTVGQQLRSNEKGLFKVDLPEDGIYYIRTIRMINVTDNEALTHQSKWATLTFEISHSHDTDEQAHDHHEHEEGIPTWAFVVGSILIIGLLFLFFRDKNS